MKRLELRVKVELEQWPDHAVLIDVSFCCSINIQVSSHVFFILDCQHHQSHSQLPQQLTACALQHWLADLTSEGGRME